MDSLLRWGIENSTPGQQPRKDLDPSIIDHILGKPDSVLMKEAFAIAVDEKKGEDQRVEALDNLEMLVEHIDNSNDLVKLQMWNPLQNLLTAPSSTPSIKTHVLWIIGTALQNNPSAQASYLSLSPLPTLLSFLHPENSSAESRSKAVYVLSGLLKHNAAAVKAFDDVDGWSTLRYALEDSDITVRRKTAFLINTLILPTHPSPQPTNENIIHPNSHASMLSDPFSTSTTQLTLQAFRAHGLLGAVVNALVHPIPYGPDGEEVEPDGDFEEKVVRVLITYASGVDGIESFDVGEKEMLNRFLDERSRRVGGDEALTDHWGLNADEFRALRSRLRQH